MSKRVWRVHEGTATITANASKFREMFRANFEASYAIRHKLSQQTIRNNLGGISGTTLSLLLGVAGMTSFGVAVSISGVISSLSQTELNAQQMVMDRGANALRRLTEYLENRPQYKQGEVMFGYLKYEYYDGSTARFIQGDDYVIQRLQIESGEWIY